MHSSEKQPKLYPPATIESGLDTQFDPAQIPNIPTLIKLIVFDGIPAIRGKEKGDMMERGTEAIGYLTASVVTAMRGRGEIYHYSTFENDWNDPRVHCIAEEHLTKLERSMLLGGVFLGLEAVGVINPDDYPNY